MNTVHKKHISSFHVIIYGFAGTILLGALLLMLPFASKSGTVTPFPDTLFTAASAVCVTGLVVHDTATYWSMFGQFVIMLLIQIGGLGIVRYTADHIMDYIELDDNYAIFEVTIPENWIGKTIGQVDIRKKYRINIMALKSNGKMNLTVHSDTLLQNGETMLVLGNHKDLQKCFRI